MCVIVFIAVLTNVIIPSAEYAQAEDLMQAGKYEEAASKFEGLNGWSDSAEKVNECKYAQAEDLMQAGKYGKAYYLYVSIIGYKDSASKSTEIKNNHYADILRETAVGSYIYFGSYEQDNNASNGKEEIEWQVLAKEGNKALLISKYALDCKPYNKTYTSVTWETCTLRTWLNNDFITSAFTSIEKSIIPTVTVSADKNPNYSTNPGNATQDKVFLLSINEATKYFTTSTTRQCKPTAYAKAQGAYVNSSNGNCWWWLRSPGSNQYAASIVLNGGDVTYYGHSVSNDNDAVRPALWIDISQ